MTARAPARRRRCLHPEACHAKGPGHCPTCHGKLLAIKYGAAAFRKAAKRATAGSIEAARARKVPITLALVRFTGAAE